MHSWQFQPAVWCMGVVGGTYYDVLKGGAGGSAGPAKAGPHFEEDLPFFISFELSTEL